MIFTITCVVKLKIIFSCFALYQAYPVAVLAKMFIRVCWQNLNKLFGLPKIYVGCNSTVVLTIELFVLWILDTGEH